MVKFVSIGEGYNVRPLCSPGFSWGGVVLERDDDLLLPAPPLLSTDECFFLFVQREGLNNQQERVEEDV